MKDSAGILPRMLQRCSRDAPEMLQRCFRDAPEILKAKNLDTVANSQWNRHHFPSKSIGNFGSIEILEKILKESRNGIKECLRESGRWKYPGHGRSQSIRNDENPPNKPPFLYGKIHRGLKNGGWDEGRPFSSPWIIMNDPALIQHENGTPAEL